MWRNKKYLWKVGQEAFEKLHGHEEFIRIFGRNFDMEPETKPEPESPGKLPGFMDSVMRPNRGIT